jgi:hypothetical protein
MASVTPQDARKNEAIAQAMVQQEPSTVSGQVGLHALGKLADMLPHEEFLKFVNDAVQAATTGQQPQEEPEGNSV